ncbi:MAG: alanine--tRNA ligase [Candidatus Micrarchaeota archaeon]
MDVDKNELRRQFAKDWEKHYKLNSLIERGYIRRKCEKCARNFWSVPDRKTCGDASCEGYTFIGNTPVKKKLSYIDTWKTIEKYFTKNGHGYIKPYPTVARWRDDLYFTIASINDFQPYVVNGELEPPANPLIVPQSCIRFGDISNVGVTGRHYTNFVMIGQHAFNTQKTGLFYWKDQALMHDINYLNELGIPESEISLIEDVWAGGGNFGPSMEYFVRGLELGNCVFMQYEVTPTGPRELKTKVIDMGAGLARLAWMTTGDATSYDVVFADVIKEMKKDTGINVDKDLFLKYAKLSGGLNEDEVPDLNAEKERIAKLLGTTKDDLFKSLEPLQALYASADHLLTCFFTINDGMLPSNVGGGYNLRMILRRVYGFEEQYAYTLNLEKILKGHADHLHYMFPNLRDGVTSTLAVLDEEKKRYFASKEKARGLVNNMVKKSKTISTKELITLYQSNGIPPEYVLEVAKENDVKVDMPGNFYKLVKGKEEDVAEVVKEKTDVVKYPKTEALYYSHAGEFKAKILGVVSDKFVILDKTAFYPEGGGQVGDIGTMESEKVLNVTKETGVALHEVTDAKKFKVGQTVNCTVDLARRKVITRHHSATHLVTAACREVLGKHCWQAGSHKDAEKAHIDITHYKRITNEELNAIEAKVTEYILANMPIVIEILPRTAAEQKYGFTLYQGGAVPGKELRIVKMGEIDNEACGGTHHMLKSTSDLGMFKMVGRESVKDGVERLTYKCGDVALKYVQDREAILNSASAVFSVSPNELPRTAERFFKEWKEQRKKIEDLGDLVVKEEAHEIIKHGENKVEFRILDLEIDQIKKLATKVSESESSTAILMSTHGNVMIACGKNSKFKANELMKTLLAKLGGSGGGSVMVASGKVAKVEKVEL